MRPYPVSLREQVVRAVNRGTPQTLVAREYRIAVSTIRRYVRQRECFGNLAPRPGPGRLPKIRPSDHPALEAQLAAHPAATLAEHCAFWEESGRATVSIGTMACAIARLGYVRTRRPIALTP